MSPQQHRRELYLSKNPLTRPLPLEPGLEGKKAEETAPRKSTSRTLKRVGQQYPTGYSPENSPAISIRGGEPWLMGYCWRTPRAEICVSHIPSLKAKKLGKLAQEKVLLEL